MKKNSIEYEDNKDSPLQADGVSIAVIPEACLPIGRSVDRESMVRQVWIPAQKTTGMTNVASHGE
jgi:hypothetical protein